MTSGIKWLIILLVLGAVAGVCGGIYETGKHFGTLECQALQTKSNTKAQGQANKKTKADLGRAQKAGDDQEKARANLDQFFNQLAKESGDETADPVDSCVLPDARLRRWNLANAGRVDSTDQGAAPIQPDAGASASASGFFGLRSVFRSKPPGGSEGIPPPGRADVQPAGVSGGQP